MVCAGRLSHTLGSKNTALSLIMGFPGAWHRPEGAVPAPQRAGQHQKGLDSMTTAKNPGAALHEELQQQLRYGKILLSTSQMPGWFISMSLKPKPSHVCYRTNE